MEDRTKSLTLEKSAGSSLFLCLNISDLLPTIKEFKISLLFLLFLTYIFAFFDEKILVLLYYLFFIYLSKKVIFSTLFDLTFLFFKGFKNSLYLFHRKIELFDDINAILKLFPKGSKRVNFVFLRYKKSISNSFMRYIYYRFCISQIEDFLSVLFFIYAIFLLLLMVSTSIFFSHLFENLFIVLFVVVNFLLLYFFYEVLQINSNEKLIYKLNLKRLKDIDMNEFISFYVYSDDISNSEIKMSTLLDIKAEIDYKLIATLMFVFLNIYICQISFKVVFE